MNHEKLLKNLVEIKSYSGEEAEIRNYIQDWFKERGIDSFVQDENLVVHFEGKDRSRAFIFNSHMDTVVAGEKWKTDPWKLVKKGERAFGLGSSDMKAGLAASMLLAEQHANSGKPPVDMWFTYVVNEEEDGSGSESFAKWFASDSASKYKDMAAIFTEPTSLKEVEYGHRGNLFVIVTAEGESGHASRPDKIKGIAAVRKIINFADELQGEVDKWNKEFPNEHFSPAMSVGEMTTIFAGAQAKREVDNESGEERLFVAPGSINKIAPECTATFDLRTTPEFHPLAEERLNELGKRMDVTVGMYFPPAIPGFIEPTEKIAQVASTTMGERKLTVSLASGDQGFLVEEGIKGVILGPGDKDLAHTPDEYCLPKEIPQAVDIYDAIVKAWAE